MGWWSGGQISFWKDHFDCKVEDQLKRDKAGGLVTGLGAVGVIQTGGNGNLRKCNGSGVTMRTWLDRYLRNTINVVRN